MLVDEGASDVVDESSYWVLVTDFSDVTGSIVVVMIDGVDASVVTSVVVLSTLVVVSSAVVESTVVVIGSVVFCFDVVILSCVVVVDKGCEEVASEVVDWSPGWVLVCGLSDVIGSPVGVLVESVVTSVVGFNVVVFIWLVVVDTGSISVMVDGSVIIVVVVGDSVVVISQSTNQGQLQTSNSGS